MDPAVLRRVWFPTVVLLLAAASASISWVKHRHDPILTYLPGDSLYYAFTAESLFRDGDFDLTNQLLGDLPLESNREQLRVHQGFFAVSLDDRVVPKHSTLLPIVSVPFIAVFGSIGFLIANVMIAVVLVIGVARLGGNTLGAKLAAILLFVCRSWLEYCFNFSPDLFVTSLVVWSYAMAREEKWLLAGLLAGFAIWAKVYAMIVLAPLAIVCLPARRATALTVTGAVIALTPMLIQNTLLYGSPLTTGYDRDARIEGDRFLLTEHYSRFNQPFLSGLSELLFNPDVGMVRTSPLWFLAPFGCAITWKTRVPFTRPFAIALALGAIANLAFFATYDEWTASMFGNRFLFPAVALGGVFLAPLLDNLLSRIAPAQ